MNVFKLTWVLIALAMVWSASHSPAVVLGVFFIALFTAGPGLLIGNSNE
ncbi:MAG: hypothetical protein ABIW82_17295 [Dokdonella sp.]